MSAWAVTRQVTRLLQAAAVVSIIASLLPVAARQWWLAELFVHFRVQYAAGQLALMLGLLAAGRPVWCLLLLPVLLFNAASTWPYVWPSQPDRVDDARLKLMTVNVRARTRDFERLLQMIESEAPDVVLILEYTPQAANSLSSMQARYPHRIEHVKTDPFGIALYSRYRFGATELFSLGATAAIDAAIETPAGVLRLLGAHLLPPTSPQWARSRNEQLRTLAERSNAARGPTVVMGDFNVSPYSPYFRDWLTQTGLRDSLAGRGLTYTWPVQLPILGISIDHCAVSEEFTVLARRHLANFGSDHRPVIIELRQGPTNE